MDENYLDSLLNEFSLDKEIDHKIEDELDEQIQSEKDRYQEEQTVSREESFNYDLEQDAAFGMPENDISFSADQIDELDNLDNLADMDIGDLDFSDIDFDDLDITKLSGEVNDPDFDELLKDFEGDLTIPEFSDDMLSENKEGSENDNAVAGSESDEPPLQEDIYNDSEDNEMSDVDASVNADELNPQNEVFNEEGADDSVSSDNDTVNDVPSDDASGDLNEDNFDADSFLDSLLEEESVEDANLEDVSSQGVPDEAPADNNEPNTEPEESLENLLDGEESETSDNPSQSEASESEGEQGSEDDLFAMLGMEEGGETAIQDTADDSDGSVFNTPGGFAEGELDMSALEGLDDIQDISEKPKKKKRTLMEILFGEPDEDDEPTEEELKAIEEKKAAKKAKKEAAKEKKKEAADKSKEEKSKKDADKKRANDEKKKVKAELKAKRKAEEKAEAANEKKLNKPVVIFIFSVLIGGVGFLYLSSVDFNYKLAIENAANYFANQKYHKAYDEIKGVEVKEKDQQLKDRIYTVMYVERLYESYENNIELGRNKKALDSLLRGVSKYYEYYDDAVELDIVSDIDYSFAQIQNALEINYGISLNRALEINELDDYEYMKTVSEYTDDESEI